MKWHGTTALWIALALCIFPFSAHGKEKILKMSTTTSTQASGLLDVLLPELEKDTGIRIKVIAKGTGAAIRDGMDGNVDVIFVHAEEKEKDFMSKGYGTKRYAIMHNDFVLLGPGGDPADIKGQRDIATALKQIAGAGAAFVSRGDDSGTHTKEQDLWKLTGLAMDTRTRTIVRKGKRTDIRSTQPMGSEKWYLSIGQGMGKAITFAEEKGAYILVDRGTYIKYRYGRGTGLDLDLLCEGDTHLANPYGVIPVNPGLHPHVRFDLAEEFAEWLISPRGQSLIGSYRLMGKQLFYPDALPE
ncbi:MAG: substrate-binding domain-containing protein [Desulfobacterales bacterium]